ncbi:MAG: hypothetical protein VX642_07085 [Bdellovibrionota bacterium]|nr:hypothetical protein [Bdellovibrionota bacterium]
MQNFEWSSIKKELIKGLVTLLSFIISLASVANGQLYRPEESNKINPKLHTKSYLEALSTIGAETSNYLPYQYVWEGGKKLLDEFNVDLVFDKDLKKTKGSLAAHYTKETPESFEELENKALEYGLKLTENKYSYEFLDQLSLVVSFMNNDRKEKEISRWQLKLYYALSRRISMSMFLALEGLRFNNSELFTYSMHSFLINIHKFQKDIGTELFSDFIESHHKLFFKFYEYYLDQVASQESKDRLVNSRDRILDVYENESLRVSLYNNKSSIASLHMKKRKLPQSFLSKYIFNKWVSTGIYGSWIASSYLTANLHDGILFTWFAHMIGIVSFLTLEETNKAVVPVCKLSAIPRIKNSLKTIRRMSR